MEAASFLRLAIGIAASPRQGPPARPRPQGPEAGPYLGELRGRTGAAHRLRHRLAAYRANDKRLEPPEIDRRHAGLYGARADRTDEPLDRFAQRPLCARRHASIRCSRARCRSPRPTPWSGSTAISRGGRCRQPSGWRMSRPPSRAIVMKLLAKTAEERYQTAAGLERDLRRCLAEWERQRPHRRLPAGRTRHARPAADPREAVWERARGRDPARRLRSHRQERRAGAGAGLRLFRHRQIRRSSMSCTRCSFRRGGCSRRASSTSTSATFPIRRWRRRFRAWCDRFSARATPSWRPGAAHFWRRWSRTARLMIDLVPELKLIIGDQPPVPELRAAARAKPFPARVPPLHRRLRPTGTSAGAVPRRSAMARRGDARPARGSADPVGPAAPAC